MPDQQAHPSGGRILVVDDEPHIRRILNTILTNDGFVVIEAEDGSAGLEAHYRFLYRGLALITAIVLATLYAGTADGESPTLSSTNTLGGLLLILGMHSAETWENPRYRRRGELNFLRRGLSWMYLGFSSTLSVGSISCTVTTRTPN